jgi:hypothetical protein
MKTMKSVVLLLAIALAVAGAAACEARLDGAACPCVMPDYTCDDSVNICRRTIDSGPGDDQPDASTDTPDGSVPDAGFLPDSSPGLPDAS